MQALTEKNLIPQELKERDQWVLWKSENLLDNKTGQPKYDKKTGEIVLTKVPYQLNGHRASSTNTSHLASYTDAIWHVEDYSGIGYVLNADDPYTAIDLDDCVIDGEITKEAKSIVKSLDSYTEYSQSGNGLHIFIKGKKPGTHCKNSKKGFEMYDKERFIIMTGNHLEGTPLEMNEAQETINYLYDMYFQVKEKQKTNIEAVQQSVSMEDEKVIQIASNAKNGHKFKTLYSGDFTSYGSQSEADQALCNMIAFYTQDYEQIDRIFIGSGLYRDKWDRKDYKTNTIEKAIHDLTATYQKQDFQLHVNGVTIPEPYVIGKNGMLYEKKIKKVDGFDTEIMIPVSRKTPYLTKIFHEAEHGQVFYEIEWNEPFGAVKEVVPASSIAKRNELLELSNKGFSVNENNVKKIIQFFDSYQSYNNVENYHATERIGNIKGKFIHPLMNENVEIITLDYGEKQLLEAFEIKGDFNSWKSEVFERIKDSPKAVFMVLASFASVIIGELNVDPFLVDLSGATSQGKTTTLEVVSTVWGNKRLMNEWNTTRVAIERKAAFLNSFPLLMDDTRKADERILKDIIYQYSGGRSKGRGSLKGSQKEYTWQNILLSTGEVSLNEYAMEQGGAAARIIPLNGQPLKKDLDNILMLQQAMESNYGAAGIEFINMWNVHKDEFIKEYHKFRSHYIQKANDNEVLSRISVYYAAVHFTGSILKNKLGLDVDLEAISKLFDEMAEENKSIDKPMQFLEQILTDLDSDRYSIFYGHLPQQKIKAIYKEEQRQLFLIPAYTAEFLGIEETQIRKEWLRRKVTVPVTRIRKDNSKTVDYNLISHKGKKMSAIALNMDNVNELGFEFYEEKQERYTK